MRNRKLKTRTSSNREACRCDSADIRASDYCPDPKGRSTQTAPPVTLPKPGNLPAPPYASRDTRAPTAFLHYYSSYCVLALFCRFLDHDPDYSFSTTIAINIRECKPVDPLPSMLFSRSAILHQASGTLPRGAVTREKRMISAENYRSVRTALRCRETPITDISIHGATRCNTFPVVVVLGRSDASQGRAAAFRMRFRRQATATIAAEVG